MCNKIQKLGSKIHLLTSYYNDDNIIENCYQPFQALEVIMFCFSFHFRLRGHGDNVGYYFCHWQTAGMVTVGQHNKDSEKHFQPENKRWVRKEDFIWPSHDCFASLINNVYNVSNKNIQCWSSPPECNAHWGDPSLSSWQSHSVVDGPVNASDKGSRAGAHWAPALEPRPLSPGQAWAANPVKHELLDRVRVCCILDTAMWDSKSFVIIVYNGYWCEPHAKTSIR